MLAANQPQPFSGLDWQCKQSSQRRSLPHLIRKENFKFTTSREEGLITSVPLGIWYPPICVSSWTYLRGTIGAGLYFLNVSWKTAHRYGSWQSLSSVILLDPQTFWISKKSCSYAINSREIQPNFGEIDEQKQETAMIMILPVVWDLWPIHT